MRNLSASCYRWPAGNLSLTLSAWKGHHWSTGNISLMLSACTGHAKRHFPKDVVLFPCTVSLARMHVLRRKDSNALSDNCHLGQHSKMTCHIIMSSSYWWGGGTEDERRRMRSRYAVSNRHHLRKVMVVVVPSFYFHLPHPSTFIIIVRVIEARRGHFGSQPVRLQHY